LDVKLSSRAGAGTITCPKMRSRIAEIVRAGPAQSLKIQRFIPSCLALIHSNRVQRKGSPDPGMPMPAVCSGPDAGRCA